VGQLNWCRGHPVAASAKLGRQAFDLLMKLETQAAAGGKVHAIRDRLLEEFLIREASAGICKAS
jgi:hypothetical protein